VALVRARAGTFGRAAIGRSILIAITVAALTIVALAQRVPAPAEKPVTGPAQSSDNAMTDVDPEVLARCQREAARKKLKGPDRTTFMNACVEPED
jgi:hypothetical protein